MADYRLLLAAARTENLKYLRISGVTICSDLLGIPVLVKKTRAEARIPTEPVRLSLPSDFIIHILMGMTPTHVADLLPNASAPPPRHSVTC